MKNEKLKKVVETLINGDTKNAKKIFKEYIEEKSIKLLNEKNEIVKGHCDSCGEESTTTQKILNDKKWECGHCGSKQFKQKEIMKEAAWDVYLNDKLIDTVFYDNDLDADYVKKSLVDHDGYDPNIKVFLSENDNVNEGDTSAGSAKKNPLHKYIRKVNGKYALVSKHDGRVLRYYHGEGYPSEEWLDNALKNIHSWESGRYKK